MKTATLVSAAVLATTVAASIKHLPHRALHAKRDMVVVTEIDFVTDVITDYTTVWVTPGFVPPSTNDIDTAPHSSFIANTVQNAPAEFSQTAPSASTTSSATVVANDQQLPAVNYPTTTLITTTASSVAATPASSAYVAPPAAAPAATGGVSVSLSYGFASPAGQTDRTSECPSGSPCSGEITFYTLDDSMSCGYTGLVGNDDSMLVLALPYAMMGTVSNSGPNKPTNGNCGRVIEITCPETGSSAQAVVVDKCMGCEDSHIDLSAAAFSALGVPQAAGTATVSWNFVD